jgi:hypothetical protein
VDFKLQLKDTGAFVERLGMARAIKGAKGVMGVAAVVAAGRVGPLCWARPLRNLTRKSSSPFWQAGLLRPRLSSLVKKAPLSEEE